MQIGSTVVYKASTPGGLRGGPESNVTPTVGIVIDIHPNGELTLYAIHRDSTRFIHAVPADQCEEVIDLNVYVIGVSLNAEVARLREQVISLAEQLEALTAPPTAVMESTEKVDKAGKGK